MQLNLVIQNLTKENADRFECLTLAFHGVKKVDTWQGRAQLDVVSESVIPPLLAHLSASGFSVATKTKKTKVCIDGMTCRACELTVEQKWKKMPGVTNVHVNSHTGIAQIEHDENEIVQIDHLQKILSDQKYTVRPFDQKHPTLIQMERPSPIRLIGLFALVFLLGTLFNKLGIFGLGTSITQSMTFAAAVVLGLVAGTSSCLAVAGGLLLSSTAKFHERYASGSANDRFRPVFLFVFGRVIGYGLLGGLVGLIGTAFTFSPLFTGGLIILAAVYMMVMGLDMLKISPKWLKACLPSMPKAISRRVMDAQGKEHWSAPFLIGAATFFLPCGFTQALQVYALTTGSFWQSGLMLAGFAIGTSPALFALGWMSSSLKGKAGKFFFQFSGALVIVLGFWNIQNGLALAGVSAPDFSSRSSDQSAQVAKTLVDDPNVKTVDGVQQISMSLTGVKPYYSPSDAYTVKAGIPVRLQINGGGSGCRAFFQIPKLGISEELKNNKTVMDFTPEKPGSYIFTCSMGMYRGTLTVI